MLLVDYLTDSSRERWEFSLRVAIIVSVTTYLVMYYQTPEPALTAYLVFFLNKPDRTSSVIAQAVMLLLFSIILLGVLLLSAWVLDAPFWRVVSMVLFSLGVLFLGSSSKLKPLAGSIAIITGYLLNLLGSAQDGELVVRGILYAWLMMAIPAGVSLVASLLIAPAPASLAKRKVESRLSAVRKFLNDPCPSNRKRIEQLRLEGNEAIVKWIGLAKREHVSLAADLDDITYLSSVTFEILVLISLLPEGHTEKLDTLRVILSNENNVIGDIFSTETGTGSRNFWRGVDPPVYALTRRLLLCAKKKHGKYVFPIKQDVTSNSTDFFLPDAFSNPEHVHYALKTTGAAMLCYFLYNIMDWQGIHTCFITCYIVSMGTAGESVEKLRLRIAGCLLGAAIGVAVMLWLIPETSSIEGLLVTLFLGTVLAGWVAAGSPRIGYAGFQIAFAFYLCILQGASPEFDLTIARDRVIGVLLGNFVAYIFLTGLWPISIGSRIDQKLLELIKALVQLHQSSSSGNWAKQVPDVFSRSSDLLVELELAEHEPLSIRPDAQQISLRRKVVQESIKLGSEFLLLEPGMEASDRSAEGLRQMESILEESRLYLLAGGNQQTGRVLLPNATHREGRGQPSIFPSMQTIGILVRSLRPLGAVG